MIWDDWSWDAHVEDSVGKYYKKILHAEFIVYNLLPKLKKVWNQGKSR